MDKKKKSGLFWDREELQYTVTATARSEAWKNNPTAPACMFKNANAITLTSLNATHAQETT